MMRWALVVIVLAAAGCSSPSAGPSSPAAELWRTAPLKDVVTGAEFSIDELRGKVVVIETMAIWCVNCRLQQREAQAALEQIGSDELIYVSLGIEPNEQASDLAAYAAEQGFDWRFAVASADVARALAVTFGDQVLSPPATPLILIGRDGRVVDQHFGIRAADALVELFAEQL